METTKAIRTKFIHDRPLPPSEPAKQKMPQANWNEKQKTILLEILVELKKSGDIGQDNSIKKAAWTTILQQFNYQAGVGLARVYPLRVAGFN
jgi:hypothetical protein